MLSSSPIDYERCAHRHIVGRSRDETYGQNGLRRQHRGRSDKATDAVLSMLEAIVSEDSRDRGYLR